MRLDTQTRNVISDLCYEASKTLNDLVSRKSIDHVSWGGLAAAVTGALRLLDTTK